MTSASRSLPLLLIAAALLAVANSQTPQTGILYWCSLVEGGPNTATSPGAIYPRTLWTNNSLYSAPCHLARNGPNVYSPIPVGAAIASYSNGTAYPNNNDISNNSPPFYTFYLTAPSTCQVWMNCWSDPEQWFTSCPLYVQTADNWATNPAQCQVPGYGAPSLYLNSGPTSFPTTYDQKQACGGIVYSTPLVDTVFKYLMHSCMHGKITLTICLSLCQSMLLHLALVQVQLAYLPMLIHRLALLVSFFTLLLQLLTLMRHPVSLPSGAPSLPTRQHFTIMTPPSC